MTKTKVAKRDTRAKSKPRDCPLWQHPNGQWCRKIKGRAHYMGTELTAALAKWADEKDDLLAGRTPRARREEAMTVHKLCNQFLAAKEIKMTCGELSSRMFGEYYEICQIVIDSMGKDRQVEDVHPEDFDRLRTRFASLAPVTVSKRVQMVRSLFGFAFNEDQQLIAKPVLFGVTFKKPSKSRLRAARNAAGTKMIEAEDLRKILHAAKAPSVRAMILLGLNAGMGNTDLAALPRSALDLTRGWINYPRPKTGIARRVPLWPETIEALRRALANRIEPKKPEDGDLVFTTRLGQRWVRVKPRPNGQVIVADSIGLEFKKLLKMHGLARPRLSFYALRHIHRTIADGSKDQAACDLIMGHGSDSMANTYRERIDDSRLLAVTETVRTWLWPQTETDVKS
jgi:integrase